MKHQNANNLVTNSRKICVTLLLSASILLPAVHSFSGKMPVTGTFSSLEYHQEGGDLLGAELRIVWTDRGYQGTLQIAEGGAGELILLKNIKIEDNIVEFMFHYKEDGTASFRGVFSTDSLVGEIRFDTGGLMNLELKRKRSYWDSNPSSK